VNPFKFGLVGSADSHISISAVRRTFFGKMTTAGQARSGGSIRSWNALRA
jgi:hypothetical protein